MAREGHLGEFFECHVDAYNGAALPTGCDLPIDADDQWTVDFEVTYDINDTFAVSVGAQNAFDSYPTDNPFAGVVGSAYPATAPGGFNGGFYYLKTRATF